MRWLMAVLGGLVLGSCAMDVAAPLRSARSGLVTPGSTFRECGDCPLMVVLPAGSFLMGSPPDEARRDPDEGPQKLIRFARPFAVAKFPVTRGEFARFVAATGHPPGESCYAERDHSGKWAVEQGLDWRNVGYPQTDRDPVVCVNFDDIRAYLGWLNRRSGGGYRLITQAEHEYGQRAGSTGRFAWGEPMTHDRANLGTDPCCHGKVAGRDRWLYTSPVGSFPANAFGLADVQGNVWQFTEDCYDSTLASVPSDGRAVVTAACAKKVVRSAGWDDPPYYLRSANRYQQFAHLRGSVTGFRVVRDLP